MLNTKQVGEFVVRRKFSSIHFVNGVSIELQDDPAYTGRRARVVVPRVVGVEGFLWTPNDIYHEERKELVQALEGQVGLSDVTFHEERMEAEGYKIYSMDAMSTIEFGKEVVIEPNSKASECPKLAVGLTSDILRMDFTTGSGWTGSFWRLRVPDSNYTKEEQMLMADRAFALQHIQRWTDEVEKILEFKKLDIEHLKKVIEPAPWVGVWHRSDGAVTLLQKEQDLPDWRL